MRTALRVLLVGLVVCSLALPAFGQEDQSVVGEPVLSVFAPNDLLVPGEETTLDVYVANTGTIDRGGPASYLERVTTARATTLELRPGSAPIEIDTGRYPVGTVPIGTQGPYQFTVTVDDDAEPGVYELPVVVTYTYTHIVRYETDNPEREPRFSDWDVSKRVELVVRVEDRPRFSVTDVDSDVQVGSRGTVTVAVTNDGVNTARDAVITLTTGDPEIRFAENATVAETFVGSWEPGETRRASYVVDVVPDAARRAYPLRAVVDYRDSEGIAHTSPPLTVSLRPDAEQTFDLQSPNDTLRVGATGRVGGEVVNTGTRPVTDAALVVETLPEAFTVVERTYPLGDLEPGDRVPFEFTVAVPDDADPGPRRFGFVVEYETAAGYDAVSDRLDRSRVVGARRDVFAIDTAESTVEVDSDNRLELVVTNTGSETVSDVRVAIDAVDPLSSDVPAAYVGTLAPGESARVAVQVTVDDDAVATSYPVAVTLTYEDERGVVRTATSVVGLDIVEPASSVPVVALVAVVAAVVLGSGWWWFRR
ncbi:Uncharacterized conserved protein [Halogranum rubrum]|uniref:Uncharacterized conserved protein n=2 Tax=Halogranum rubrum TaxID=553466 RepID=A0A1I4BSV0_9EURY|nr:MULTISPECIES: NEW3 domain-containing protein [Halogranum]EJN58738.1 hypothetical protein HSB1_32160 [Halogranum salarium B-1]SFK71287.1 Uncharacterized conserved protein [Halogranum rubrum]